MFSTSCFKFYGGDARVGTLVGSRETVKEFEMYAGKAKQTNQGTCFMGQGGLKVGEIKLITS